MRIKAEMKMHVLSLEERRAKKTLPTSGSVFLQDAGFPHRMNKGGRMIHIRMGVLGVHSYNSLHLPTK